MRDRLTEWLPLLLVGVLLVVFQFTRPGGVPSLFSPEPAPSPAAPLRQTAAPASTPVVVAAARATPRPANAGCPARFANSLASLKNALGATMGDALECERPVDNAGNTQQRTTTGLAYYRAAINAACFTTGWEHWALTGSGGLVHWTGDAVEPPGDATPLNR